MWLAGHRGDAVEVVIPMQQSQPTELGGGGHDQIDRARAAMSPSLRQFSLYRPSPVTRAIIDRLPAEQRPHILDRSLTVS